MIKVIETQGTPNPDSLKFIVDQKLVKTGARSFEDAAAAKGDLLAEALFNAGPVASVFYMDRFVTVTKFASGEWTDLQPTLQAIIEKTAQPILEAATEKKSSADEKDGLLSKIHDVIDENVRPALAGDGGGLEILGLDDFVLSVHYQGACGSCPSASAGTLYGIQSLLQRMVDERIQVVSV